MISSRLYEKFENGAGPIRTAFQEAARQRARFGEESVFDFSIGDPKAPVPEAVKRAIAETALDPCDQHGYMSDAGYEWVRQNIADSLHRRFGTPYEVRHIIMSVGAAGAINAALCAVLDFGDEVVLIPPYYPSYVEFVKNFGGVATFADVDPVTFQPDIAALERAITPRTKAVIVNSPNNPSGAVYSRQTAEAIAALLREKSHEYGRPVYLLSDEPYRELVYTGEALPVWAEVYPDSIMAYSFSKSLSIPGERIGYAAVSPYAEECDALISAVTAATGILGYVNAPAFFQKVVGKCVDVAPDVEFYAGNGRLLYRILTELGFSAVEPRGAFYIFLKSPLESERDFLAAATGRHLIFVGGSAFGYPGYVRLSFCGSGKMIERSAEAFKLLARDCGLKP